MVNDFTEMSYSNDDDSLYNSVDNKMLHPMPDLG